MSHHEVRLGSLADIRVSSVDKHTVEGEVPVRLCNYTDVYYGHELGQDREYMAATATPDEIKKFRLEAGDVLITKDSETADDIGIPALITETAPDFICGYHLAIIRPDQAKADPRYLNWALGSRYLASQFEGIAPGVTRVGLKTGRIKTLRIPVPDGLAAQRRIADYLDRETATIDALIKKQRQLLLTLRIRRRCIVESSLARLDLPAVPLRRLMDGTVGIVVTPAKWYGEDGPVAIRGLNIRHGFLDMANAVRLSAEGDALHPKSRVSTGDVVVVRTGDAGRAAVIPPELDGAQAIDVLVVHCNPRLDPQYLVDLLTSRILDDAVKNSTNGTIQGHLNVSSLRGLSIPLPSLEQQRVLVRQWSLETSKIDALIAKAERFIELAQERRAALITAAVTGQLEIPAEESAA